jgi:hypothetical protein
MTGTGSTSADGTVRDRLRDQLRREQALATHVTAAEARLTAEIDKRAAAVQVHDDLVARRTWELAAAIAAYIDQAGVSIDRAAAVFNRPRADVQRLLRMHRAQPDARV